jgi:hypothetical protein
VPTEVLPPFFIFRSDRTIVRSILKQYTVTKKVRESLPEGWGAAVAKRGWNTAECFLEYVKHMHQKAKEIASKFPILLVIDECVLCLFLK